MDTAVKVKETKIFSTTLLKQDIKSNIGLIIAITVIMCLMCTVINYAESIMGVEEDEEEITEAQSDFYSYLYIMASFNEMAGTDLSYDDFESTSDRSQYEMAFDMLNEQSDMDLSVEGLEDAAEALSSATDVSLDTYISQFEYVYALGQVEGCFSGEALDIENMMSVMLESMGLAPDLVENMSEMDMTGMINQMYFTMIGLLPILLLIVIVVNSLLADQVDRGSMAYILSTPTRRSAVVITQAVFMIIMPLVIIAVVCGVRIGTSYAFYGSCDVIKYLALYAGMYVLVESLCGICYLSNCLFNRSRTAMILGGGITVWCFLASILAMFGTDMMVDVGMGVEMLGNFKYTTLVGLYDIEALATVGSGDVDMSFLWKLIVLAAIALGCYVIGGIRFNRKDLPL